MPPDPHVFVGVAAVVHRVSDNALLMIRRGGTGSFASDGFGTWAVPGGWIDFGETPLEAAVREVAEEAGVVVRGESEMGFVCCQSEATRAQIVTLFIGCRYVRGEPAVVEPAKCPEVAWVPDPLDGRPLFAPLVAWRDAGRSF